VCFRVYVAVVHGECAYVVVVCVGGVCRKDGLENPEVRLTLIWLGLLCLPVGCCLHFLLTPDAELNVALHVRQLPSADSHQFRKYAIVIHLRIENSSKIPRVNKY
jgi:hypothetical protein